MDEINEIYCSKSYEPFLDYCELHHYKQMRDLVRCRFEELPELIHISNSLLSRIKTIYFMFLKQHPGYLTAPKPVKEAAAPKKDDLEDRLLVVFQQNANKLIHISEITKAIGKSVKRNDILHTLEHLKWCKIVDASTFFYSPGSETTD